MLNVTFETTANVTKERDLTSAETTALLDYLVGELNADELRVWAKESEYRSALTEMARHLPPSGR